MEQYWQELQQQVHRKAALERKQDALCEQRRKLKEELDAATQRWQEEQKDVDKLEGISLAGIFSALSGGKEEQLEKERQEKGYSTAWMHTRVATAITGNTGRI